VPWALISQGQSGNSRGRPKKHELNEAELLRDVLFKAIRIKDGNCYRSVPKIVVAAEVCLNNAIKGDTRAFFKIMALVDKNKLLPSLSHGPRVIEVRRIIVDPKDPNTDNGDH
jgi:hypothetical protein